MNDQKDFYLRLRATAAAFAQFKTAIDVAAELKTTKVSIYSHLRKLKALGYTIETTMCRQGARGPHARAFRVTAPELSTQQ